MLKTNDSPTLSVLDINNLTTYIQNDGTHPPVVNFSWCGQFPKNSGIGGIFQEGIIWGGKVTDGGSEIVRVGGDNYKFRKNIYFSLFICRSVFIKKHTK